MDSPMVEGVGDEVVVAFTGAVALFIVTVIQWALSQPSGDVAASAEEGAEVGQADNEEAAPAEPGEAGEASSQENVQAEVETESTPKDTVEVQIRLKYLNDTERCVEAPLGSTVGSFKDRFFHEERLAGKAIRLISCGKLLNDETLTLRHFGVAEGNNVLHVQISAPPLIPNTSSQQQAGSNVSPAVSRLEANIASLAYLVLGAMLVLFWYVHFQYRDLFTNSATTALVGISGLFCVFVFAPSQPLPLYFHTVAQQIAPEM